MAMSAATLWELSGGRAMLGLGSGHRLVMERWHGDPMRHPVAEMREYVAILRGILTGHPLRSSTKWASDMPLVGVAPAPEMPLMIGALAPAMLRLAGEIGDGVMVWLGTPDYIADVVIPNVRLGRELAGKSMDGFDVVASIPCAATPDVDLARQTYVKQIAHNLRLPFYRGLLERGGYTEDLALVHEVGRYEDLEQPIPADAFAGLAAGRLVADIAAVGDDAALAAKLCQYRDAGVTTLGINPIRISDFDDTLLGAARAMNSTRP
jgi:alkanesulfonate monooxygenase SsuD/methylene tetrahydromethanopterin reductase-like flavin-dependent oxidoreductase (luciferase family)